MAAIQSYAETHMSTLTSQLRFERLEKYLVILLLVLVSNGIFHKKIIELPVTGFYLMAVGWSVLILWRYIPQVVHTIIRDWPMTIVLILSLASVFWSLEPMTSLRAAIWLYMMVIFGLFIAMRFSLEEQLDLVLGMALFSLFSTLFLVIFLPQFGVETAEAHKGLWRGIYTQKNHLGPYLSLGFVAVFLAGRSLGRWRWLVALLLFIGIYNTGSATAMASVIGLALIGPIMMRFVRLRHELFFGLLLLLTPIVALFSFYILMNYEVILNALGRDVTLTGRTELWSASFELIRQYPLTGFGLDASFSDNAPIFRLIVWQDAPFAHNHWIDMALDVGLVATVAFGIGYIVAVIRAVLHIRTVRTPESYFPLFFLLFILISTMSTESLIRMVDMRWVIYVAVIYGLVLRQTPPEFMPYRRKSSSLLYNQP
jgi:exopolysaccharide production protein ExoQ